jgi:HSP20 family protein
MNITKFNPVHPADSLSKWMDNLVHTTLADVIGSDHTLSTPSVNIVEHENSFSLQLAAPGLTKQDFNINIENDRLVISAEKKSEKEETKGRFTRREFSYGSFKRSFQLDDNINREGISASYEDGVLNITLPKKEEVMQKQTSKTIEIS